MDKRREHLNIMGDPLTTRRRSLKLDVKGFSSLSGSCIACLAYYGAISPSSPFVKDLFKKISEWTGRLGQFTLQGLIYLVSAPASLLGLLWTRLGETSHPGFFVAVRRSKLSAYSFKTEPYIAVSCMGVAYSLLVVRWPIAALIIQKYQLGRLQPCRPFRILERH